jgi:hypothetical protein
MLLITSMVFALFITDGLMVELTRGMNNNHIVMGGSLHGGNKMVANVVK